MIRYGYLAIASIAVAACISLYFKYRDIKHNLLPAPALAVSAGDSQKLAWAKMLEGKSVGTKYSARDVLTFMGKPDVISGDPKAAAIFEYRVQEKDGNTLLIFMFGKDNLVSDFAIGFKPATTQPAEGLSLKR